MALQCDARGGRSHCTQTDILQSKLTRKRGNHPHPTPALPSPRLHFTSLRHLLLLVPPPPKQDLSSSKKETVCLSSCTDSIHLMPNHSTKKKKESETKNKNLAPRQSSKQISVVQHIRCSFLIVVVPWCQPPTEGEVKPYLSPLDYTQAAEWQAIQCKRWEGRLIYLFRPSFCATSK